MIGDEEWVTDDEMSVLVVNEQIRQISILIVSADNPIANNQ